MRENFSTDDFDKTFVEENNYITGITDDEADYIIQLVLQNVRDVIHHLMLIVMNVGQDIKFMENNVK